MKPIQSLLRFYFITDDGLAECSPIEQARMALESGATVVQYRNKKYGAHYYKEAVALRELCHNYNVPLIINDNILLARAVGADGVHLGQDDEPAALARQIMGPQAIIGLSVSTVTELSHSRLDDCDYIGTGPVYGTQTKPNAKPACGLQGLKAVADLAPVPVVAIGGITAANAADCFRHGAAGVAVISAVSRAENPEKAALELAAAIGAAQQSHLPK